MDKMHDELRNIIAAADPDDPEDVAIRTLLVNALCRNGYPLGMTALEATSGPPSKAAAGKAT